MLLRAVFFRFLAMEGEVGGEVKGDGRQPKGAEDASELYRPSRLDGEVGG